MATTVRTFLMFQGKGEGSVMKAAFSICSQTLLCARVNDRYGVSWQLNLP
jgi:hypothetical protein